MSPEEFSSLCADHGADHYYPFRQRYFRETYLPQLSVGLCSPLVDQWLGGRFDPARDGIPPRATALAARLRESLQHHLYLDFPITGDPTSLSEAERRWLLHKYGVDTTDTLNELMRANAAGDLRDLDVALAFPDHRVRREEIVPYKRAIWTRLARLAGVRSRVILVLSGHRISTIGLPRRHRMALRGEASGGITFFDPNAGTVTFSDWVPLSSWLHAYWFAAGYARRPTARLLAYLIR